MNKHGKLTLEELYKLFPGASDAAILALFEVFSNSTLIPFETIEYWCECEMCGIEMSHRACGMCVRCEQVWNG